MQRLLLLTLVLAGAPALAAPPGPTWRNIGPGGGGWIPTVCVSPHSSRVLYAGCDVGGFFRSTDAGATWRPCNTGLHDYYVECIAPDPRDPKVIYIGTEGGVHKSTDGGATWHVQREGFPPLEKYRYSAPIGALAVDPTDPKTVYAGIGRPRQGDYGVGTVYRTRDGGAHWQIANPGGGGMDPKAIVSDLLIDPRDGRRVFAATDHGLYRSEDSGASWQLLARGLPGGGVKRVALCRARPNVLYVSVWSPPGELPWRGGVYRSDDGGDTWSPRLRGLATRVSKPGDLAERTSNIDRIIVHPSNPDIVWAGDSSWVSAGVYRTLDGGQSWQDVTKSPSPAMNRGWIDFWGVAETGLAGDPLNPDTLYLSTSGSILRTTDRGDHWQPAYTRSAAQPAGAPKAAYWSTTGLEVTCLNGIYTHPSDPRHLYFCYFDIGLLQSFDGGRTFARTVEGMKNKGNTFAVAFDPDDPKVMYAGTGEWAANHGDVCRSDDGGLTWRIVGKPESGLPDGQTRHLLVDRSSPRAARRVFASVQGAGLYRSDDGGSTWRSASLGSKENDVRGLVQDARDPAVLYALLSGAPPGGGLYVSRDHGATWQAAGTDFPWYNCQSLAVCPSDPRRMYVAAREIGVSGKLYPGGIYASTDGGKTWREALSNRFMQTVAVDPRNADEVFAGGIDYPYHDDDIGPGVLRSRDGGRTWQPLNSPSLACVNIDWLTLDTRAPARLYAGTGGGGVFVCDVPR